MTTPIPRADEAEFEASEPRDPHKTREVWVLADVDLSVAAMVEYLQSFPGVRTSASCQGTLGEGGPNPYRAQVLASWPPALTPRLFAEFDITLEGDGSTCDPWGYLHPREGWSAPPPAQQAAGLAEARERLTGRLIDAYGPLPAVALVEVEAGELRAIFAELDRLTRARDGERAQLETAARALQEARRAQGLNMTRANADAVGAASEALDRALAALSSAPANGRAGK